MGRTLTKLEAQTITGPLAIIIYKTLYSVYYEKTPNNYKYKKTHKEHRACRSGEGTGQRASLRRAERWGRCASAPQFNTNQYKNRTLTVTLCL